MENKMSAVILNYNDSETTRELISKIVKFDIIERILIVDNCSLDNSFSTLSELRSNKVEVIQTDKNGGYGYGNNFGIMYLSRIYQPDHIMICNPDIEVSEPVLNQILEKFESDESIAVVAPFMLNRDGKKDPGTAWKIPTKFEYIISAELLCGHFLTLNKYLGLDKENNLDEIQVDCVAGSLLVVDTKHMVESGMYDENIFLYGEETSLGCKLKKAGLKTVLLNNLSFIHLHKVSINESSKSKIKRRKRMLNSRIYILKEYLNANFFDVFLARVVFALSMVEYRVLLLLN